MSLPNDPLQIGDWLVDPRDDSIVRGSERIKLEPRTMRLLMMLAQAPGQVVSQDQLLETVWSGVVVGPASVYQSVSQLRKVLGDTDDPPHYIETVARKGYRLLAAVSAAPKRAGAKPEDAGAGVAAASVPAPEPAPGVRRHRRWPVAVLGAALAILGALWQFWLKDASSPTPPTVVVLPFLDLTEDKNQQIFCDGLTEEMSSWLAQIPTLHVVARTSAFAYRNRNQDARLIGQELKTTHMVEGSIRKSGDHLRITVQLIDTRTGLHVWSESYDFEKGDALTMQEDVARKVADNLELRITAETDSRFAARRSHSEDAERLYLLAMAHMNRLDNQSNEKAIELFGQALAADPGFSLAKVWLANAIVLRRSYSARPVETLAPEVEPLLADVAKTTPELPDLYVVRGYYYTEMRRRDDAIRDLRHALELNPNSSRAASKLGFFYLTAGEPRDALTYYTMAADSDPRSHYLQSMRCLSLVKLAEFTGAAAACERARALGPDSAWVYSVSSSLEIARGDFEAAFRWNDLALKRGSDTASIQGQRASWLVTLGLLQDAATVYQHARIANPDGARRDPALVYAGSLSACATRGTNGLREFMRDNDLAAANEPTQLFELANAALTSGDPGLANELVSRALASPMLLEEDLASPWNASVGSSYLLVIAAALRASGDSAGADRRLQELNALLDRMANAGVRTHGAFYARAQVAAMRGMPDQAMVALQQAAQMGWREAWAAEHQPYLATLRDRSDFRELLAAVNARNADTATKLRPKLLD